MCCSYDTFYSKLSHSTLGSDIPYIRCNIGDTFRLSSGDRLGVLFLRVRERKKLERESYEGMDYGNLCLLIRCLSVLMHL